MSFRSASGRVVPVCVIIGLWYGPFGIAAAAGLALYFVGVIVTHLRKRDFTGAPRHW
jgi:hypothetical protein